MGKRLFIAVDVDQRTREQIRQISSDVRARVDSIARASWVQPDRMHLTLHFVGDADEHMEQRLRRVLAAPIAEPAFDLSFDRLGYFPDRGSPRVLWLGVLDGLAPLGRIQEALGEYLQLPSAREGPFTPHLTLARFRDRVPRTKLARIGGIPARAGPTRIDRVTLYESRLSTASLDLRSGQPEVARRAGPAYLPLADAMLRGSTRT